MLNYRAALAFRTPFERGPAALAGRGRVDDHPERAHLGTGDPGGRRACRLLARGARRGGQAQGRTSHRRRDFFGPKPVLMVVEPASLCWLTGRMVKARDGVTWAEEFARYPALKAVVRDDGSGLGKGLKLERARRRAAGQADIDDTLDIFHPPREGGRALRTPGGGAPRALEAADAGQRGVDRLGRGGPSRTGKVKKINRLWREAEQLWDQAYAGETEPARSPAAHLSSLALEEKLARFSEEFHPVLSIRHVAPVEINRRIGTE